MKTTTTFGWPVAEGTDPAKQYPPAVDDPFKTSLDTTLAGIRGQLPTGVKIRVFASATFATDAGGVFSVTNTQLGLTTITGCMASVLWGGATDGATANWCTARINSAKVEVIVFGMTSGAGATVNKILNKSGITGYVLAWGT